MGEWTDKTKLEEQEKDKSEEDKSSREVGYLFDR